VIVNLLISTLFPRLCDRALMTAWKHGAEDIEFVPIIVGPEAPLRSDIIFCEQKEKLGSNAANRVGLESIEDDAIVVLAADDVIFNRDWLKYALPNFLALEKEIEGRPAIMGLRHIGGIGTTYGRMYANFPMFRRNMLREFPSVGENFCPPWLVGQWGDCALGMAIWREGGKVADSGTNTLIRWADRMGFPESPMKYQPQERDIEAFRDHFADMSAGWPRNFRGFNIDCFNPAMIKDGTICEPRYENFVKRYNEFHTHG
jgi:hypothetical protein